MTAAPASSRFSRMGRLLLVLAAFCGFALADTIGVLKVTGPDNTQGGNIWIDANGTATSEYAGVLDIVLTVGKTTYPTQETLCVDLFTNINSTDNYTTDITIPAAVPPKNPEKDLLAVSWIIDEAMLPALLGSKYTSVLPAAYWLNSSTTSAGTGVQRGEALQLAVWDMTVDNADGFSKGGVQQSFTTGKLTDQTVIDLATYYENAALGQWTNDAYVYINTDQKTGLPGQMLEGPKYSTGPPASGPEPTTFILVGTALIGIGWIGRRRIGKPAHWRA